jgi:hypothetical protein
LLLIAWEEHRYIGKRTIRDFVTLVDGNIGGDGRLGAVFIGDRRWGLRGICRRRLGCRASCADYPLVETAWLLGRRRAALAGWCHRG